MGYNAHENEFLLTDFGFGHTIYSIARGLYVGVNHSVTGSPLQARAVEVGSWERFEFVPSTYNGRQVYHLVSYYSTSSGDSNVSVNFSVAGAPLQVRTDQVGSWELFYLDDVAG